MIVDRERRDLLGEAEEEDGGVEQVWLEFRFEVDGAASVGMGGKDRAEIDGKDGAGRSGLVVGIRMGEERKKKRTLQERARAQ